MVFNPLTSLFTSAKRKPVQEIAESTQTGSATTILSGLAVGMEASVWSVVAIVVALAASFVIFRDDGLIYMLYGVAMVGIGMLSHTGNNVAMDSFGPIADNANGIGEMAGVGEKAWELLAELDAVGNTTKAITKQVAIASAVVAATALFFSFVADALTLSNPGVPVTELLERGIPVSTLDGTIGFLLGGALPFLFSAFSLRAVARGANLVVNEVRRQFKIPGVLEGTKTPDYGKVVSITTAAAQKELVSLVALSVGLPLLVGLIFEVEALGAFLAGVILTGPVAGRLYGHRRRRAGQCQKVRGRRALWRQGLAGPQGRHRGRHRGRSAQGHGRPGTEPDDQGGQPGQPAGRAPDRREPGQAGQVDRHRHPGRAWSSGPSGRARRTCRRAWARQRVSRRDKQQEGLREHDLPRPSFRLVVAQQLLRRLLWRRPGGSAFSRRAAGWRRRPGEQLVTRSSTLPTGSSLT